MSIIKVYDSVNNFYLKERRMSKMTISRVWVHTFSLISLIFLAGCGDGSADKQGNKNAPIPSVVVSTVKNVSINPTRRFVGRTEAVEDVQIRARISGYLLSMDFIEGQDVTKGDLLFEVDSKPYQAEVSKLAADVRRQRAALTNAKRNYRRGDELIEKGFISAMEMDDLISSRDQAEGSLAASEASLDSAKLNLSYTKIIAPISGRIGRKSLSIGDLVSPESGVLVTIVTVNPMYVTFDVSEKLVSEAAINKGSQKERVKALPVPRIELPNGEMYEQEGQFDFIDNRVDPATGTVKVRAVFPNEKGGLIPGQYVTAVVSSSSAHEVILVPQAAVSEDQQGHFVMVVNKESQVKVKRVEMGDRIDVSWVVEKGLTPGDQVIVEGIQKVRSGQHVEVIEQTVKAFDNASNK